MPPSNRCPHYAALLARAKPFLGPWTKGVEQSSGYATTYKVATHAELMACPDECHFAYQLANAGRTEGPYG